jgi:NitT/TauT family transport system substrate-binding protein
MAKQPAVAARYAAAWAKAVKDVDTDPKVRDLLPKYMNTSADIAPTVPLAKIVMVKDLKPQDLADFQKFVDIGVAQGVVKGAVDTKTMVKAF